MHILEAVSRVSVTVAEHLDGRCSSRRLLPTCLSHASDHCWSWQQQNHDVETFAFSTNISHMDRPSFWDVTKQKKKQVHADSA